MRKWTGDRGKREKRTRPASHNERRSEDGASTAEWLVTANATVSITLCQRDRPVLKQNGAEACAAAAAALAISNAQNVMEDRLGTQGDKGGRFCL